MTIIETPSFINVWTRIISTCPQLTQLQSDGLLHDDSENTKNVNNLDSISSPVHTIQSVVTRHQYPN